HAIAWSSRVRRFALFRLWVARGPLLVSPLRGRGPGLGLGGELLGRVALRRRNASDRKSKALDLAQTDPALLRDIAVALTLANERERRRFDLDPIARSL